MRKAGMGVDIGLTLHLSDSETTGRLYIDVGMTLLLNGGLLLLLAIVALVLFKLKGRR